MSGDTEPLYQNGADCWGVLLHDVVTAWQMLEPPPVGAFLMLVFNEPPANANNPIRPTIAPPWGW